MSEMVRTEEVFFAALERPSPADRAAYLDEACAGRPALRARLEKLLAAHPRVGDFLAGPPPAATAPGPAADSAAGDPAATGSYRPAHPTEAEGAVIAGRYRLRQRIGEGGMGTVWMADQTEPVRRKVAVKLIRVEWGQSKTILARFEAERQAIALMDHPHIAKLLDAGTSEGGAPFFVMELVKGIPLNDFCDQYRLPIPERLDLFTQICSAVQHAHQKGVIHRDLKPSNILVESHDGKPVPRVIDFGLAKATTGLQLTEQSMFTAFGSVMGTPLYMAPEQARFNAVDVDTRADVYALGVILYELLTGTTPLTKAVMKKAALDEMLRLVREQEAPTPSSRLSSANGPPGVAASRQIEPLKLARFVKGELDWIVLKALSKDRDRRYETATSFARDIERFLSHEPVTAGPPSARYLLKKFVRRNRGQVVAAGLVFLALIAGVIGTTLGLWEAKRQQGLAVTAAAEERQAKQEAEAKRKEAETNLAFATKGNDILGAVFSGLDPKANYATVGELAQALKDNLGKAVEQLDGSAIGDPLVVAGMQDTLGRSLLGLGDPHQAIVLFEKARATYKARLGPDHPDTLASMNNLASAYGDAGRPVLAVAMFEDTLRLRKARLGPDHPDTLTSVFNLAQSYRYAKRLDLALPLYEETLRLRKARLGPDHLDTLNTMYGLAAGYRDARKYDLALPLYEEALALMKAKFGPDHTHTLNTMNSLALGYRAAGELDLALPLFEETLKLRKARLGPDHLDTLSTMTSLALTYAEVGMSAEAAKLMAELLAETRKSLPKDSPQLAGQLAQFSLTWLQMKGYAEAEPPLREALAISEKTQPDAWTTYNTRSLLGGVMLGQKKYAEALPLLRKGYEGMKAREKAIPPQDGTRIPEALDRLIELYTATNQPDEARTYRDLRSQYPALKETAPMPTEKK